MATRTISTLLALDGEAEYRSKMAGVNASLREMQSALKLADAECKNTGNSQASLTAKGEALNNLLAAQQSKVSEVSDRLADVKNQAQAYKDKIADLNAAIKENEAAMKKAAEESGKASDEYKNLEQENQRLKGELDKASAGLNTANNAVKNLGTALNKAKTDVKNTETAIKENTEALNNHNNSAQANAAAINALAAALVAAGLKRGLNEIAEALTACVKASVDFESAMAGVAKTTNMSDAELASMGEEIKRLSSEIPVTAGELAGIVEVAGQLGIKKDDLVEFSTVMANLGVATNMTSEEAATMLARFANVTGMAPENYGRLGATIVDLGNNFATTEQEITKLSQRLAASGKIAGLSEPEILALATAMTSVGIEAEAGGTAMSQTLTQIGKYAESGGEKLDTLAKVAGMSSEEFSAAWESKPIEAIEAFIRGLGNLDEEAESTNQVLDNLGMTGIRQSNMLKSLGLASDVLSGSIKTANSAWTANSALVKEAATRYATTESKFQMFKNSVSNLKIAVGDQLTPALSNLASSGSSVLQWATDMVQANESLVPVLTALTAALTTVAAGIAGFAIITKIIPLIKALNLAMASNPAFLIATGIAALTAAVITLAATLPSATQEADELNEKLNDSKKTFDEAKQTFDESNESIDATSAVISRYIGKLEELDKKTSLSKEEQSQYNAVVAILQELLPDMDLAIDETTGRLNTSTDALRDGAAAWEEYARQKALATMFDEQIAAITDLQVSVTKAEIQLENYNATATQGTFDYVAALDAERDARIKYAEAYEASAGKETEALAAARSEVDAATEKSYEHMSQLTADEIKAAEAMAGLRASISETNEELDKQTEELLKIQSRMEEFSAATETAAETTSKIAEDVESANESLATLGEGTGENLMGIPAAAATAMAETQGAIDAAKPDIIGSATDMGTQSSAGFESEISGMSDAATEEMSEINQAVADNVSAAHDGGYDVGAAIAQGAASGIADYASQVAAEAAQMVTDAIAAAKKAAESNSPSKKMIVLGKDMDRGLIAGIKDMEDDVLRTIKGTIDKVTSTKVEMPDIQYKTEVALRTINTSFEDTAKAARNGCNINQPSASAPASKSTSVTNNFYVQEMDESTVEYFVRRINTELGAAT